MEDKTQSDGIDHISSLPDELLHHVMSFLKAWEVVRTSMLSRRWRHLWASAPYLDAIGPWPSNHFVNSLLHWREDVPLKSFLVCFNDSNNMCVEPWIKYAIRQKIEVLEIWDMDGYFGHFCILDHATFVSPHLKSLTLISIGLDKALLKLLNSSCPALEKLELRNCFSLCPEIFSCTIKYLVISNCDFASKPLICVPSIVELHLDHPFFEDVSFNELSSLRVASISIGYEHHVLPWSVEEDINSLGAIVYNMFKSLFHATVLEVLAPLEKVLLESNLQDCPNFSNLKHLSLGEWCVDADFNVLVLFLQHTPVLEKLTLHLYMREENETKALGGGCEERKRLFTCQHLKLVEIKCYHNDEMAQKLMSFFQSNGIPRIIVSQKINS